MVYAQGNVVMISSKSVLQADEVTVYTSSRTARAVGHVHLAEGSLSLWAEEMDYDSANTTATLKNAYITNPPWRIWGRKIRRVSKDRFVIERAAVTNCDLDPPHFHFRGIRATYRQSKRYSIYGSGLAQEDTPVIFAPLYTRTMEDKDWSWRFEPGHTSRDGRFVKNIITYPLGDQMYGRFYWDYFQKTGYGLGAEYNYFRPDVRGSVYGYQLKDRLSKSVRWNTRLGHWQQLKPSLSLQANAIFQSDESFSNLYSGDNEYSRQTAQSDAALTYQRPTYTSRWLVRQDQTFDTSRNRFVRQRTVLPQWDIQSTPLLIGSSVYATLSGSFANTYTRPSTTSALNPVVPEKDIYQQTANASASFSRPFALMKSMSYTPSAGLSESWQAWEDITPAGSTATRIDRSGLFSGRAFTSHNLRQRFGRSLDMDLSYSYRVRGAPNALKRDKTGADEGVEQNGLGLAMFFRPTTAFWSRASSGYDLRTSPGLGSVKGKNKVTPPTVEFNYRPLRKLEFFYRQTQQLYPVNRPQITQFSAQWGDTMGAHISSGWSYNSGTSGSIQIQQRAAFPLTRGWFLQGGVQYTASGERDLQYNKVQIIEKTLTVVRDLHCWVFRAEVTQRPGLDQVSFNIDLKTDLLRMRSQTSAMDEAQYFQTRRKSSVY